MAKKKKQKEDKKPNQGYQIELKGVLLILIAIIGFGQFGIVGNLIASFAAFIVGTWYNVLLVLVFIIGAYMIIKREAPNFFTTKLIGLYIMIIAILTLSHTGYVEKNDLEGFDIIIETVNNFMGSTIYLDTISGGGIIGALFSTLFVKLFEVNGTKIVIWTLFLCGFILLSGITIADVIKNIRKRTKSVIKHVKDSNIKSEVEKAEKQYEKDERIVVSSVDELIHIADEKQFSKSPDTVEVVERKEEVLEEEFQDNKGYQYPPDSLLAKPIKAKSGENQTNVKENARVLEQVFKDFSIEGKVVAVNIGPAVTQYEIELKAGTKVSKVLGINREIALALAAKDVRIQAPIPGKKTIGIELPNKVISMVTVREILEAVPKKLSDSKLLVTLGKDIMGNSIWCEINKTPHLLVAGATGSGKSVCINSIIISILMRTKPDEVKLVLVDPKKVELSMYNGVPHLLAPVVTEPKKANIALKKIVVEMERRYDLFSDSGTKNIAGYNTLIDKKNETLIEEEKVKKLPYIVVIIDELADLMLVAAKEVEDSILRITQMARAAGIHLIVATQRPSTDVITGLIKANIPSRIAFAVSSSIDSRTILDMTGAEKLLGKGDMLFLPMGENMPIRVQGTFISEEEIKSVVDFTVAQQKARYDETLLMDEEEAKATTMVENDNDYEEPLYNEIVEFVVTQGKASASLLQRRFRLGYNRAARVIDLLEERGIVGPNNGSKPREVLVKLEDHDN
ncbi:MAG: DNA translocase FtsK [Bacilli bacterium]|nr:DNA translocase FtsK [Bacilli bacterium]